MKKRFALIGAGGYIAPKHLEAIKNTGNELVVALDTNDSVGILDSYFPKTKFFVEFERFDRHVEKLKKDKDKKIDYISICSPNYLHDSHIRFALRAGANVICEKPIVLNPWNVDALKSMEEETKNKINTILQLRLHPNIVKLKKEVNKNKSKKKYKIDLKYYTYRGKWYDMSWKGDVKKSGGIITNIGIHFFDILLWIFGDVERYEIHINQDRTAMGLLKLKRANITWILSVGSLEDKYTPLINREMKVNNRYIDFNNNFLQLHVESYKNILEGNGFDLDDTMPSVKLVSDMRKYEEKIYA